MIASFTCFYLLLTISIIRTSEAIHQQRIPGRYLVEFAGYNVERDSDNLLNHLTSNFPEVKFSIARVIDYDLMRAVTLQMDVTEGHLHDTILKAISNSDMTLQTYPVHHVIHPSGVVPSSPESTFQAAANAELLLPHRMTQVDRVHNEFGNTGQGIYIAIIDSGI